MRDAILEFREGRYVACFIWSVFVISSEEGEPKPGDLFGMVYRDADASTWTFDFRYRWYADDKHWGSADEKSAYTLAAPLAESEDSVAAKLLGVFGLAQATWPGGCRVIEAPRAIWVRSADPDDVLRVLSQQDFASIRTDPDNEPS